MYMMINSISNKIQTNIQPNISNDSKNKTLNNICFKCKNFKIELDDFCEENNEFMKNNIPNLIKILNYYKILIEQQKHITNENDLKKLNYFNNLFLRFNFIVCKFEIYFANNNNGYNDEYKEIISFAKNIGELLNK